MTQPSMREAALGYARRGWHVFPLHTPREGGCSCRQECGKQAGKHPRTRNGLLDATLDLERIESWWSMWPDANIGISCGPSALVVLDVDPRHGGDESLVAIREEHPSLTETLISLTGGGGAHYIYRAPKDEKIRNSNGAVAPGVDVRGDGGYVVAPPSLHLSGRRYEWETGPEDGELGPWPLPRPERASASSKPTPIGDVIPQGERDSRLTSIAGGMRYRGMEYEEILAALEAINRRRCVPPLPLGDLQRIARSVCRYAIGKVIQIKTEGVAMYDRLRKVQTDPPIYVLAVNGIDVQVNVQTLTNHSALRVAVFAAADLVVSRMKNEEWDTTLDSLMKGLEILPAPRDASAGGVAWEAIREYLSRRDEDEESFGLGKPIERDGLAICNGMMLRNGLRARDIKMEQQALWALFRDHGGAKQNLRINGKQEWSWTIPVTLLEEGSDDANF